LRFRRARTSDVAGGGTPQPGGAGGLSRWGLARWAGVGGGTPAPKKGRGGATARTAPERVGLGTPQVESPAAAAEPEVSPGDEEVRKAGHRMIAAMTASMATWRA